MKLNQYQIETLVSCLPRDKDGIPIMPWKRYKTTGGTRCTARYLVIFDVTVLDGNRYRTTTEADVELCKD